MLRLVFESRCRDEIPIDCEGHSAAILVPELSGLVPMAQDLRCLVGHRYFGPSSTFPGSHDLVV